MKEIFEKHCKEYNLDYDFKALGSGYANLNTNQAYILFKSLTKRLEI